MQANLVPDCAEPGCAFMFGASHGLGVSLGKACYSSFGTSAIESPRWKCRAGGLTDATHLGD